MAAPMKRLSGKLLQPFKLHHLIDPAQSEIRPVSLQGLVLSTVHCVVMCIISHPIHGSFDRNIFSCFFLPKKGREMNLLNKRRQLIYYI